MSFSFSPFFSISFCSSHIQFNLVSLLLIQFKLNCIVLSSRTFVYRLCFVRCFAPTRWSLQRRHFQSCNPRSRQIWQTSETFNFSALLKLLDIHEQIIKVWHFNHPTSFFTCYFQAFVTDRAIQSRLAESLSTGRHAGDDHDHADDHVGQSDDHADGHEDKNNDHNYVFKLH